MAASTINNGETEEITDSLNPPISMAASEANNEDRDDPPTSLQSCFEFLRTFCRATGTVPILIVTLLVAFGIGSVVGVVPDVIADRYARTRHHYSGPDCATFNRQEKPDACQDGADDAQYAAAVATLVLNLLTLIFNPVVGTYSDRQGRRGVIIISVVLYSLGTVALVFLQLLPWLSPNAYYFAVSLAGAVDFTSMSFAAASDVLSPEIRAAGYGILLSGFYAGFSLAPQLPLLMNHFQVSVLSVVFFLLAIVLAFVALPETLPQDVAEENRQSLERQQQRQQRGNQLRWSTSGSSYSDEEGSEPFLYNSEDYPQSPDNTHWIVVIIQTATKPLRDMEILTTGNLPILAAASFFSAMVYSSDKTLIVYYIEDQLNVRDDDIAKMFLIFCPLGVVIQAFFLQPMLNLFGEKNLMVIAFVSGTCHNLLYGLAKTKNTILVALCLSQLTKVSFPLLSAYASKSASVNEQGRVQGALFALNALANAVGPMILEFVYDHSKNGHSLFGPGSMFVCASGIYAMGTIMVTFLPKGGDEEDVGNRALPEVVDMRVGTEICGGEDDMDQDDTQSLREPLLDRSNDSTESAVSTSRIHS
ncbi:Hippocampus abundant transcript 1 protein [Seminavis robusta]|uniref:Hippocampus abundant transcript 1 protein n=1 Tax=Seminavis robusta TaxID=568900 RepID=A0A9N8DVF8_9STRA|nr:Hippocampus abundant transcript 1 protein [Seminavis robusta]|eukprot:Sro323_g117230.1 Hippocampus abundant transcript 1 protein (589) ;mRNA; r:7587-9353